MELSKKLQIPEGVEVYLVNVPKGVELELKISKKESSDSAVLVFAKNFEELDKYCKPAVTAARADRLSWIAYPKSGQLDTDLNRDKLWKFMKEHKIEAVRLVSAA